jgi:hypothetical protein
LLSSDYRRKIGAFVVVQVLQKQVALMLLSRCSRVSLNKPSEERATCTVTSRSQQLKQISSSTAQQKPSVSTKKVGMQMQMV